MKIYLDLDKTPRRTLAGNSNKTPRQPWLATVIILYGLAGEEAMDQEETQLYNTAGTQENIKAK